MLIGILALLLLSSTIPAAHNKIVLLGMVSQLENAVILSQTNMHVEKNCQPLARSEVVSNRGTLRRVQRHNTHLRVAELSQNTTENSHIL